MKCHALLYKGNSILKCNVFIFMEQIRLYICPIQSGARIRTFLAQFAEGMRHLRALPIIIPIRVCPQMKSSYWLICWSVHLFEIMMQTTFTRMTNNIHDE